MRLSRRGIIFTAVFVLLLVFLWNLGSYYLSLRTLIIEHKDVEYVNIFDAEKLNEGVDPEPIKENVSSGQEIRLPKGLYTVYYKGSPGYEDRYIEFELSEQNQKLQINPSYNEEKLRENLDSEFTSIKKSLEDKYPQIGDLYDIKKGELYSRGEWYGTTLVYKGTDSANRDTLRVVLNKDGSGQWTVKTDPPDIVLSKRVYQDIPDEVLRAVNTQPVPDFDDHGTGAILNDDFF